MYGFVLYRKLLFDWQPLPGTCHTLLWDEALQTTFLLCDWLCVGFYRSWATWETGALRREGGPVPPCSLPVPRGGGPAAGLQPTVTLGVPVGGGPHSQVFQAFVELSQQHQPVLLPRHLNPGSVGSHQVPEAPKPPKQCPGLRGLVPSSSNLLSLSVPSLCFQPWDQWLFLWFSSLWYLRVPPFLSPLHSLVNSPLRYTLSVKIIDVLCSRIEQAARFEGRCGGPPSRLQLRVASLLHTWASLPDRGAHPKRGEPRCRGNWRFPSCLAVKSCPCALPLTPSLLCLSLSNTFSPFVPLLPSASSASSWLCSSL